VDAVESWITLIAYHTGIIVVMSCTLTIIGHFLIRQFPRGMLHLVNLGLVVTFASWATLVGIYSTIFGGVIYGIVGFIILIIYVCNLRDVEITTALLVQVNHFAQKYHSLFWLVVFTAILAHVYSSLAGLAIGALFGLLGLRYATLTLGIGVYYLFSLWWTAQVILNFMRTVVAGTVGIDYERRHRKHLKLSEDSDLSNGVPSQKTVWHSCLMAAKSFGGICYGSLLVSPVSLVRGLFGTALQLSHIRSEPLMNTKETLDKAGRNFNKYAFSHVALYGTPYHAAANETWDLMVSSAVGQVADDASIGSFVLFSSTLVALLSAFADVAFRILVYDAKLSECMIGFLGYFLLALIIPELYLKIIEAGNVALLVCLADEPQKLPPGSQLRTVITAKYPRVLGDLASNSTVPDSQSEPQ
jgi:hypothetical protein